MKATFLAGVTALAVLSTGLFVALERPSWVPLVGAEEEPVLIFLVGSRQGVETLKRAVDPSRIVAESPDAVALVEGRMVATHADAVAAPLTAAGWTDRKLEILQVPRRDPLRGSRREGAGAADDPRMQRLNELMSKPTLSYGEALFVMNAMNDGLM